MVPDNETYTREEVAPYEGLEKDDVFIYQAAKGTNKRGRAISISTLGMLKKKMDDFAVKSGKGDPHQDAWFGELSDKSSFDNLFDESLKRYGREDDYDRYLKAGKNKDSLYQRITFLASNMDLVTEDIIGELTSLHAKANIASSDIPDDQVDDKKQAIADANFDFTEVTAYYRQGIATTLPPKIARNKLNDNPELGEGSVVYINGTKNIVSGDALVLSVDEITSGSIFLDPNDLDENGVANEVFNGSTFKKQILVSEDDLENYNVTIPVIGSDGVLSYDKHSLSDDSMGDTRSPAAYSHGVERITSETDLKKYVYGKLGIDKEKSNTVDAFLRKHINDKNDWYVITIESDIHEDHNFGYGYENIGKIEELSPDNSNMFKTVEKDVVTSNILPDSTSVKKK